MLALTPEETASRMELKREERDIHKNLVHYYDRRISFLEKLQVEPDTSASSPRAFASMPVGKPTSNEYKWHPYSFPTGNLRVRVLFFVDEFHTSAAGNWIYFQNKFTLQHYMLKKTRYIDFVLKFN